MKLFNENEKNAFNSMVNAGKGKKNDSNQDSNVSQEIKEAQEMIKKLNEIIKEKEKELETKKEDISSKKEKKNLFDNGDDIFNKAVNNIKNEKKDKKKTNTKKTKKKNSSEDEVVVNNYTPQLDMVKIEKYPEDAKPDFDIMLNNEISRLKEDGEKRKKEILDVKNAKIPGGFWVPLCTFLGLGFLPMMPLIGGIPGYFIGKSLKNKAVMKHQKACDSADENAKLVDKYTEENIEKLKALCEEKANQYKKDFAARAKEESLKFIESSFVKDVSNRISERFFELIEEADRRSHIVKLEIPYDFSVYEDKIVFENEEYNFEIERCKNLTMPIEQTAVARAIASEIQINTMTKYAEDPSGTTPFINSYFEYKTNEYYHTKYTLAEFIYTAPNGNYKEVKDWN